MPTKTNLLFIFTDEQSTNTIGSYGNCVARTPNIDALAAESTVFDRCYVTQPVCTPSRSSLLTGLYPHTNGCSENNLSLESYTNTIPELLGNDEYTSGYIGKWHLGDEIFPQHGFDEWVSIEDYYIDYYGPSRDRSARSNYHHFLIEAGFEPDVTHETGPFFSRTFAANLKEEYTKAHFVADSAIEFIRRNSSDPFTLCVNFIEPHMPFHGPRDNLYPISDIPIPATLNDDLVTAPLKTRLFAEAYRERLVDGVDLRNESGWRELIRRYWGLVSMVDSEIGRIVHTLNESGAGDRTLVVFTSDHGDMMGSHGLVAKCVMFEEAVRVPLIIRMPEKILANRSITPTRYRKPVSQIDLVPTILDALECPQPDHLEGRSILPNLDSTSSGRDSEARDVVIEWNGMNSGFGDLLGETILLDNWRAHADEITLKAALDDPVRTLITPDGWKYSWSHRDEDQLFHLPTDPLELQNLSNHMPNNQISSYRSRIEKWQGETLDPVVFG